MDKIKNKYEVILGFVTLVVSLSAFKDELAKINLVLGYKTITLADYFLYIVYGFCICLYFYVIEHISRDTKIVNWKIFEYILRFAYFIFVLILMSPVLIILNLISFKIYQIASDNLNNTERILRVVNVIISSIAALFSILGSTRLYKDKQRKEQKEIEEQEIKELDNTNKLYQDGYYSHSVLESFKVLETHLFKKLNDKNIRVQRHRINDIIKLALKEKIIEDTDIASINNIKEMRNVAAHSDTVYTKQQAEFALNFLKQLLQRNSRK